MRRGELAASQEETAAGFRWMVELPDEAEPPPGRAESVAAATLEADLAHEREVRAILERELEARRREVSELHVLLERAQRILPATAASQAETMAETSEPPPPVPQPVPAAPRSLTWRERILGRTTRR